MKTLMKRVLAVSLAAALLLTCAVCGLVLPASADTATVKWSDDFEGTEVTAKVKGWKTAFGSTIDVDPLDETNKVWKLTKTSTATNYCGAAWGFAKNHNYELSFRAYIPAGASSYFTINSSNGERGIVGGTAVKVTANGQWVTYKMLMHTMQNATKNPNDGYAMIMKAGGVSETAPIYIDDMVFTDLGVFDGNYVLGGDFESAVYNKDGGEWKQFFDESHSSSMARPYVLYEETDGNHCLYLSEGKGKVSSYYNGKLGLVKNTAYELSFRVKGGMAAVYLNSGKGVLQNTGWTKWNTAGSEEWKTVRIPFVMGDKVDDNGYVVAIGLDTSDVTTGTYIDDIRIVATGRVASAPSVTGGTLTLTSESDDTAGTFVAPAAGEIVTVKATAKNGYLMVPGTLTYTDASGNKVKILNESLTDDTFGGTAGDSFQFVMPEGGTTVTAQYVSTADQTFAMDTVGTSLRVKDDGVTFDGIRFLTRLNMATKFDEEAQALTVEFGGVEYEIVEFGSLLKRYEEEGGAEVELTKDNAQWTSKAYTKGAGMRLLDYTEAYVDFTSVMITSHQDRVYTARGYVVLEDANGAQQTIYCTSQLSNSIASASTLL